MNIIDITQELSQNFIDFSYEANSQRAFPDARDGLKPGQRACLWEMYVNGYTSEKPHVKSAKIDGGVAAKWWPHGTTAIYETFARMSQDWINNIPEVDWHGGNGSVVISAEPAADRYTEARLSKATEQGLLGSIKKNVVKMIPNFSDDAEWPEVLPAIMPRLLVNGSQGIGVTIANVWLPHSLDEITEVIKGYVETGVLDYSNLAPSFPSGGIIINKEDLSSIYKTGKGKAIVRARAEIKGNKILITELPYQVYIEPLIEKIKELMIEGNFEEIQSIDNKTSKNKILIEVECNENPEKVLAELYQATDLQKSYNANQMALVGKTPKLLNFQQYIDIYLEHNISCVKKEYQHDIAKAKVRLEVLEGLLKALEDIDNVIAVIRASESEAKAKQNLKEKYKFTGTQVSAIVSMRLGKLAHLEKVELNKEQEALMEDLTKWMDVVSSQDNLKQDVLKRLIEFANKFSTPRKTEVSQIAIQKKQKEKVVPEPKDCVIIVTNKGTIKRVDTKNFKPQKRNTTGIKSNGDIIAFSQKTNTQDTLMVFSSAGKMYRILVDNIPEGTNVSTGVPLSTLIEFEDNEVPMAFTTLTRDTDKKFIFFATKKGIVKKVPLTEYDSMKRTGIVAIKFKEGDELAAVTFINQEQMMLITKNGMSIRFETAEMPISSRTAQGVKGMNVSEDDYVINALPISNSADYLTIVSENGLGKKTELKEFNTQNRGGKGIACYKDKVAGGVIINAEHEMILISGNNSSIVINSNDIPLLGRTSIGNIMIKNNTKVLSIAKV